MLFNVEDTSLVIPYGRKGPIWCWGRGMHPERFSTRRKRLRCAWRIRLRLNDHWRFLTSKIAGGMDHDDASNLSDIAVP